MNPNFNYYSQPQHHNGYAYSATQSFPGQYYPQQGMYAPQPNLISSNLDSHHDGQLQQGYVSPAHAAGQHAARRSNLNPSSPAFYQRQQPPVETTSTPHHKGRSHHKKQQPRQSYTRPSLSSNSEAEASFRQQQALQHQQKLYQQQVRKEKQKQEEEEREKARQERERQEKERQENERHENLRKQEALQEERREMERIKQQDELEKKKQLELENQRRTRIDQYRQTRKVDSQKVSEAREAAKMAQKENKQQKKVYTVEASNCLSPTHRSFVLITFEEAGLDVIRQKSYVKNDTLFVAFSSPHHAETAVAFESLIYDGAEMLLKPFKKEEEMVRPNPNRTASLVLKNFPTESRADVTTFLACAPPASFSLHGEGSDFHGMVFVKYPHQQAAAAAYKLLRDRGSTNDPKYIAVRVEYRKAPNSKHQYYEPLDETCLQMYEDMKAFALSNDTEADALEGLSTAVRYEQHLMAESLGLCHDAAKGCTTHYVKISKPDLYSPPNFIKPRRQAVPSPEPKEPLRNTYVPRAFSGSKKAVMLQPVRQPLGPDGGDAFRSRCAFSRIEE